MRFARLGLEVLIGCVWPGAQINSKRARCRFAFSFCQATDANAAKMGRWKPQTVGTEHTEASANGAHHGMWGPSGAEELSCLLPVGAKSEEPQLDAKRRVAMAGGGMRERFAPLSKLTVMMADAG